MMKKDIENDQGLIDRRGIDGMLKKVLVFVIVSILGGAATMAGSQLVLAERVTQLERTVEDAVDDQEDLDDAVLTNSKSIESIAESQKRTADILEKVDKKIDKIDERQREIELNMRGYHGK